jgi:hypothetical protein
MCIRSNDINVDALQPELNLESGTTVAQIRTVTFTNSNILSFSTVIRSSVNGFQAISHLASGTPGRTFVDRVHINDVELDPTRYPCVGKDDSEHHP